MVFLHSKFIHLGVILALAAGLAAFHFDRAEGPAFHGLSAVTPETAHVYLYRQGALAAYGQGFGVTVDGSIRGQLPNASYLRLSLTPGRHRLEVAPGARAVMSHIDVDVRPGEKLFFEFVFPTGLDMQPLFDDAVIARREEREALLILPKLRENAPFLVQDAK